MFLFVTGVFSSDEMTTSSPNHQQQQTTTVGNNNSIENKIICSPPTTTITPTVASIVVKTTTTAKTAPASLASSTSCNTSTNTTIGTVTTPSSVSSSSSSNTPPTTTTLSVVSKAQRPKNSSPNRQGPQRCVVSYMELSSPMYIDDFWNINFKLNHLEQRLFETALIHGTSRERESFWIYGFMLFYREYMGNVCRIWQNGFGWSVWLRWGFTKAFIGTQSSRGRRRKKSMGIKLFDLHWQKLLISSSVHIYSHSTRSNCVTYGLRGWLQKKKGKKNRVCITELRRAILSTCVHIARSHSFNVFGMELIFSFLYGSFLLIIFFKWWIESLGTRWTPTIQRLNAVT